MEWQTIVFCVFRAVSAILPLCQLKSSRVEQSKYLENALQKWFFFEKKLGFSYHPYIGVGILVLLNFIESSLKKKFTYTLQVFSYKSQS